MERSRTAAQLAADLGLTYHAVRRWPGDGCPHDNLGRGPGNGYRFNADEVRAWVDSTKRRTTHGGVDRSDPGRWVECGYCGGHSRRSWDSVASDRHCSRACRVAWTKHLDEWRQRVGAYVCTSCSRALAFLDFYPANTRVCKACISAKQKAECAKPKFSPGHKQCADCGEWKAAGEFFAANARIDGLMRYCKVCSKRRSRAWKDKKREESPDYFRRQERARTLQKQYGMSVKRYNTMLACQGGVCAICLGDQWGARGVPCVDHDHDTGNVRGLLCQWCNSGIGQLRDDPTNVIRAAQYLVDSGATLG